MPSLCPQRANPGRLPRRQDGVTDPILAEQFQRRQIHTRFRKPHPLRLTAEAGPELGNPPLDQRGAVSWIGKRQDCMDIWVGHGIAVAATPGYAVAVALDDSMQCFWGVPLQPARERGADIKADPRIVIDQPDDPFFMVQELGPPIRRVALRSNPLIPVVVGGGGGLLFDLIGPGVLTRRLVEVAVDDQRHRSGRTHCGSAEAPDRRVDWIRLRRIRLRSAPRRMDDRSSYSVGSSMSAPSVPSPLARRDVTSSRFLDVCSRSVMMVSAR